MSKGFLKELIYILIVLIILGLGIAWTIWQWRLCRQEGLNFWYCIQHIF